MTSSVALQYYAQTSNENGVCPLLGNRINGSRPSRPTQLDITKVLDSSSDEASLPETLPSNKYKLYWSGESFTFPRSKKPELAIFDCDIGEEAEEEIAIAIEQAWVVKIMENDAKTVSFLEQPLFQKVNISLPHLYCRKAKHAVFVGVCKRRPYSSQDLRYVLMTKSSLKKTQK